MQPYTKTVWVNDETYLNADNMNKMENQLDTLTDEMIDFEDTIGDINTVLATLTTVSEVEENA